MKFRYVKNIEGIRKAWLENQHASGISVPLPKELVPGSGKFAAFPKENMPSITSSDLRKCILNLVDHNQVGRFYLRGFRIKGRLSLEGLSGKGGSSLKPISFIECLFEDGVCFASSHLTSLSLRGSRFGVDRGNTVTDISQTLCHINLTFSKLKGNLDLSQIRPFAMENDEDGKTYLKEAYNFKGELFRAEKQEIKSANSLVANISGSNIQGRFSAENSIFVEDFEFVQNHHEESLYSFNALNISDCTFHKRVMFSPCFAIIGGLSALNIVCHSELWIAGAFIHNGYLQIKSSKSEESFERPRALNFQSSKFHRTVYISQERYPSEINGMVFLSAVVAEDIVIECVDFGDSLGVSDKCYVVGTSLSCKNLYISDLDEDKNLIGTTNKRSKQDSPLKSLSFKGANCNRIGVKLKTAILSDQNAEWKSLDFSESSVKRLSISTFGFETGKFLGTNAEKIRINIYGSASLIDFSGSEVKADTKIKGMVKDLNFSKSSLGNLNLEQWSTPGPKDASISRTQNLNKLNWPTLTLERCSINGAIDVGGNFAPDQISASKYELSCFKDKRAKLVITKAIEKQDSEWRDRRIQNQPFKVGLLSSIEFEDGRHDAKLSGYSDVFHKLPKEYGVNLDTKEKAIEYLCLFCTFLVTENEEKGLSQFRIVTLGNLEEANRKSINSEVSPPLNNLKCQILRPDKIKHVSMKPQNETQEFKIIEKMNGFSSLKEAIEFYQDSDFKIPNGWDPRKDRFAKQNFSDWLIKLNEKAAEKAKVEEENKTVNAKKESEITWFIPAACTYQKSVWLAVFKLKQFNSSVEMLDDTHVCSTDFNHHFNNQSTDDSSPDESHLDLKEQQDLLKSKTTPVLFCPLADFGEFISRGPGRSGVIELNRSQASEKQPFDKLFPSQLNLKELKTNENVLRRIWGVDRSALVNLSDCSCELLADGSGHGWGDFVFFKTDRFNPKMLKRYEEHEDGQSYIESTSSYSKVNAFGRLKNRLNKLLQSRKKTIGKIVNEVDLSPDDIYKRGYLNDISFYSKGFNFKEKRLLWLSRYHDDLDNTTNGAKEIDIASFRRVARNYRSSGLEPAAKYIDEARIYKEGLEFRNKFKSSLPNYVLILSVFVPLISLYKIVSNGGFSIGINLGSSLFICLFIGLIISAKSILRLFLTFWDYFYRASFRYGLSLRRPLLTILGFIFLGTWATKSLDENGFLVIESTAVTPYAIASEPNNEEFILSLQTNKLKPNSYVKSTNIRCGNTIDYGVFAVDMFIPLIELDQSERCLIRPFDPSPPRNDKSYDTIFNASRVDKNCNSEGIQICDIVNGYKTIANHPTTWRFLQSLYVLAGWIMVSATLLIFSSQLRRTSEGDE